MRNVYLYSTDERGLDLYEYAQHTLREHHPDADAILLTDFPAESDEVQVVNVRPLMEHYGIYDLWYSKAFPPMSFARLLVPLLPELGDVGKAFYLDTDTEVMSGDVRKVFDLPMSGAEVLGVEDNVPPLYLSRDNQRLTKLMNETLKTGAIDGCDGALVGNILKGFYVNSGCLLMDVDAIRRNGYGPKFHAMRNVLSRHKFRFVDQDIINMMLVTGKLDPKFGVMATSCGGVFPDGTVVAHFAGGKSTKAPFLDRMCRYLGQPISSP